ncbi:Homogentisate 1,2-dioxygenase [Gonapodya prolifera JEL478]|uniref:homogentisate 1,2-dioxygenase n=1 Tax=Gonapodya prolifera (strain JEL478) TaxID=1344416 RepID=A0A139A088_GONPJ|nr:Homogentisate 1,2-dioxygenase [Gonapodya prolifera JEL478]|eukprot:KXS09955.1 Homogentisate 1,2-dioxygenase [Gonapodya prolifera JEL478]
MAFLPRATVQPVHPSVPSNPQDTYRYNPGYGNDFSTEALPGALPIAINTPISSPYNLYSESISGTSFTMPRKENQRSWLYRIRPATTQTDHESYAKNPNFTSDFTQTASRGIPNVTLWTTFEIPDVKTDFVDGIRTVCGAGSPSTRTGLAVHIYACNTGMAKRSFMNADGDMLIAPEKGILTIQTEMGWLSVGPNEIFVIPRGIKFRVDVTGPSRGYITESWSGHFDLPDRGPIGANHLASARDFLYPVAAFEDKDEAWELVSKYDGELWRAGMDHSPFDVVAWHGNYAPCKYDLHRFAAVGSVTWDHIDPSSTCVLQVRSNTPGLSVIDFCAVNPPRWMSHSWSIWVPYYHRNCMTEIAINVKGPETPMKGGMLLVPNLTPHGQDRNSFEAASHIDTLKPQRIGDGEQVILIESSMTLRATKWALGLQGQIVRGRSDLVK